MNGRTQEHAKKTTNPKPILHIPLPIKEVLADVLKVKPPDKPKRKLRRDEANQL
jgi:hypothetical protein